MRSLLILLLALPSIDAAARSHESKAHKTTKALPGSARFAIRKLQKAGLSRKFIDEVVRTRDDDSRDRVVGLNVLGFLVKEADYSRHFSPRALERTSDFLKENRKAFSQARTRYGVDPEIIASLLWVETQHGRVLGDHSVSGVYFNLLQADEKSVMKETEATLADRVPKVTRALKAKIRERSREKARWALEQLKVLASLHKKDPKILRKLKGSFAGAFGIPQFIPSSYKTWAVSSRNRRSPDLFAKADAIQSVANYLRKHGYRRADLKAERRSVLKYNHSEGYVNVIFRIADCVRARNTSRGRVLASVKAAPSALNCER